MKIEILQARESDVTVVSEILSEAGEYLESIGQPFWKCVKLSAEAIAEDVRSGLYFLAWENGEAVGTLRFQLEDKMFWPDIPSGTSTFVHRLAVRRKVAGRGVSTQMLNWAKTHTKEMGRRFLRLDCDIRPKLCAVYEKNGFVKHSERQVGPYYVARYECDVKNMEFACEDPL